MIKDWFANQRAIWGWPSPVWWFTIEEAREWSTCNDTPIKYIPDHSNLGPEEAEPTICPLNEGYRLCIHRGHNDASKIINAHQRGYTLTGEDVEPCDHYPDHDHYPVAKKLDI